MMNNSDSSFLALDVGRSRTGVAITGALARLPAPLTTLTRPDQVESVLELIREHNVSAVVVGLPRGLSGQNSAQTEEAKSFADKLKARTDVPVHLQDEAVTSIKAEDELKFRGKPYSKEDIDALSATYILEDFLSQQTAHDKLVRSA